MPATADPFSLFDTAPAPIAAPSATGSPAASDDPLTLFATSTPAAPTKSKPETAEDKRIADLMTPGPPSSTASTPPTSSNVINFPGLSGTPHPLDLSEVADAARKGYADGAVVTPEGVNAANSLGYGLGYIPRTLNMLSGGMSALYEGAKDITGQATDSVVPGAGRDVATGLDLAAPFAGQGPRLPMADVNLLASRSTGAAAAIDRASPLSLDFKAAPMAPTPAVTTPPSNILAAGTAKVPVVARDGDKLSVTYADQPTAPPASTPGPTSPNPNLLAQAQPIPSAAPPGPAAIPNGLTPEQIAEFHNIPEDLPPASGPIKTPADAAQRADQIISHFASIGNTDPIPGATGALPTITGNSGLATLYRAVRDSDTPVPFTTLENASKTNAMGQLRTMQGTPEDLTAAKDTRSATVAPMYEKAWANKTDADFAAPTQTAQDILKSPLGQNDTVAAELPGIVKKLQGQTDPEQLKGIADNIDATLDRLGTEGKADRQTRMALGQVKDSIMSSISDAAPGFDAAQAEFSKQSRRIDEMKYLQGRKLTDLQGNPTLGNMRSTLDDISKKQAGDKFNPADSVTPENMATLQQLHDQMQREQLTQSAGKSLGSNTFQNLATNSTVGNIAGHFANHLVNSGVGAAIDFATGLHGYGAGGMVAGNALAYGAEGLRASQAARQAAEAASGQKMLMGALRDRLLNIDNKGVQSLSAGR